MMQKFMKVVGIVLWSYLAASGFLFAVVMAGTAGTTPSWMLLTGLTFLLAPILAFLRIPYGLVALGALYLGYRGSSFKESVKSAARFILPLYIIFVAILLAYIFFLR